MPQILKVDPNDPLTNHAKHIRNILETGGVIAFPSDTYYGLGVNPFNEKGIRQIFKLKSRAYDKPLLVLIATELQLSQLAKDISQEADQLIKKFWPTSLTLVFNAVTQLPSVLTADTGKIGIRLPKNEWTRRLIETVGCPLTATSANKSGGRNTRTAEEVAHIFGNDLDLIIDSGPAPGGKVSTLVDTTLSPPVLLRHGAIAEQEIDSCLKNKCNLIPLKFNFQKK